MRRLILAVVSLAMVLEFAPHLAARGASPIAGQAALGPNEVRVSSNTPGADLGAKINSAVAACGARRCDIWVTEPGTISTSPDIPQGDSLHLSPGTYNLTTTWHIRHSGTIYDFGGAVIRDVPESPNGFAIEVGKGLSGTVSTNGRTVTWVSGSNFADIDPRDILWISGKGYNVASVQSSTELKITGNAGDQTGARYFGVMGNNFPAGYSTTVVMRDLTLNYAGPASQSHGGILLEGVKKPFVENVRVAKFERGTGWLLRGTMDGIFLNIQAVGNATHLYLGELPPFSGSNVNTFISPLLIGSTTANGNAIAIGQNSFLNTFIGADIEDNRSTAAVLLGPKAFQTNFENSDFEQNGDGTPNSRDISNFGTFTKIENCKFSSNLKIFHSAGIFSGAGSKGTIIRDSHWIGAYGASYDFVNGATGRVENNIVRGNPRNPPPAQ